MPGSDHGLTPMAPRLKKNWQRFYVPSIGFASAVLYLVIAVGVPIPLPETPENAALEPFPCMYCQCGCRSAAQCWSHCCCHTLVERIEWARDHGVRPPDFALAAAAEEGLDLEWLKPPEIASGAAKTAVCFREKVGEKHSCCCHHDEGPSSHAPRPANSSKSLVGWRALECQGKDSSLTSVAPAIPLARESGVLAHSTRAWLGPPLSDRAAMVAVSPPVPPPERA